MTSTSIAVAAESPVDRSPRYDVEKVRKDFPILQSEVHGKPLVYLDNAATSQKPKPVIDALRGMYEKNYSNVHRGVHFLSQSATEAYEGSREKIRSFINAAEAREIIFVRGTTEGINLVRSTFGQTKVGKGEKILISAMEHHSNIVPWQLLCEEKEAELLVAPINDRGEIIMEEFDRLLTPEVRLVSIGHMSNALGTINPVKEIIRKSHDVGAAVLVDGAQAAPHMKVDVQDLDCDFYAFSGHKMYGPSGIGVLYGKAGVLESLPPYQGGGDMIASVTFEKTTFNSLPYKFEAGTPNIVDAVGLGAAVDYIESIGIDAISIHEDELLKYGTQALSEIPGLRMVGTAARKGGILSFVLDEIHPHDIGTILDQEGIAIRTGHHCAQPVMDRFGVPATARASVGCYNTVEELDALVGGLHRVIEVFS